MAKKNRKKGKVVQMLSPENYIKQKARTLPIHECRVNAEWEEDGLADILVARKHTNGNLTVGMYLVDIKCLGVKDAQYNFNMSPAEYSDLLYRTEENMELEPAEYVLVHNIIYAGIEFAEDYGFHPHKDFIIAEYILEEDTDDIELMKIPCGKNDKPFYVRGPLDSDQRAKQIIAQLEKTAGPGNYTFVDGLDAPWDDDFTDDEFEPVDFDDITTEEKFVLIMDSITRIDKLSTEEADQLGDLIESVFLGFIDLEKADEYYENFITKMNEIEIVEKAPDEMFKECGIPTEQLSSFKTDFDKVDKLIGEEGKGAKKELKRLKDLYPENAALQYLELSFLQIKESKKYGAVIDKSIQLYPNFPLIYLFSKIHEFKNEAINNDMVVAPEIDLGNILEKVFPNRKILYISEAYYMVFYLALQVADTANVEQLEALSDLIYDIGLSDADVELLDGLIRMAKMTFVVGLIESLNSKN